MSLSFPFFFGWLLNKKVAWVEVVNISLVFLYWVGIALHPWPFISDIAIFVLERDVKRQLTNWLLSILDCSVCMFVNAWVQQQQQWIWIEYLPVGTAWCLTCPKFNIVFRICLTDFSQLFRLLDGLDGTTDECCTCIRTVIHEAERFKRYCLADKLRNFLQRKLTLPPRRPSAVVSTAASSSASSSSSLSRTAYSTSSVTVNCNHQPDAV